jgi:hypothetical protein
LHRFKKIYTKTTFYINHFLKITIMKKIFYSIFAVAALALTSCAAGGGANILDLDASKCDDTTEKCWKYTAKHDATGVSADTYLWATEKAVVEAAQQAWGNIGGYTVTLEESSAETPEDCYAKL